MEEMFLKLVSDQGLSLALLVCGIVFLAKQKKMLEEKGLGLLEDINNNLKEFSKMQELIKKVDTQEFSQKMDKLQETLNEIKEHLHSKP